VENPSGMNVRSLRLLIRTLAVALAVLALLPARGDGQALPKVVVGMTPTDDAAALLYAVQAGLFRRAGIDVDIQKAPSGSATAAALAGGTFQFGSVSAISAVTAIAKGVPLQMVAPGGLYNSTTDFVATVVKRDSPIQTGRDFNGRIIGSVSLQDLNTVAILNWIDQHGGDLKSVKVIEIPYATLIPALDEGRIDAATLIQPGLSQGLATGKVRILAKTYDAIATRFYITTWMVRSDWAAANVDTVRKFATVVRDAEIYANAHKAETAALVAPFAGMELDVMLKGGRDTFAATYMDPKGVQPVIDSAVKYKLLDQRLDANDMIAPAVRGMR
jgi:NitT/TauT family transport system substrate-binding protein